MTAQITLSTINGETHYMLFGVPYEFLTLAMLDALEMGYMPVLK